MKIIISSATHIVAFPPSSSLFFLFVFYSVKILIFVSQFSDFDCQMVLLSSDPQKLLLAPFHLQRTLQKEVFEVSDLFAEHAVF